jgi:hypothetical protein
MNTNQTPQDQQIHKFIGDNFLKEAEGKTLIIRTGPAQKLLDEVAPQKLELTGTIDGPGKFYNNRKSLHDPLKCHVLFNKLEGTIVLVIDEQKGDSNFVVKGKVIENPELVAFKINQKSNAYWQPKELMDFLYLNRSHFQDRETHTKLMEGLMSFKAKISHEIESTQTQKGNDTQVSITKLENEFTESFVLVIPIYKGQEKSTFKVDVFCRVRDKAVEYWFQSIELKDIQTTAIDKIMSDELKQFEGVVCIEQ